jgi:hypothetical protein
MPYETPSTRALAGAPWVIAAVAKRDDRTEAGGTPGGRRGDRGRDVSKRRGACFNDTPRVQAPASPDGHGANTSVARPSVLKSRRRLVANPLRRSSSHESMLWMAALTSARRGEP